MNNINLKLKNYNYFEGNSNYYIGSFFYKDKMYKDKNMTTILPKTSNINEIKETLKNVSGYFSYIEINQDTLVAVVDHIRSYPLFYAVNQGVLYISDSADWIKQKLSLDNMNETAKNEFKLAGYVTGKDTLYSEIKQLQAGELLKVDLSKEINTNSLTTYQYLNYNIITKESDFNEKKKYKLIEELDEIVTKSIKNLMEQANGEKIIIPLSAGYDSRIIILKLKELGYENVLAFTYGSNKSKEIKISKEVAANLGYEWKLIPYTKKLWKELFESKEKEEYFRYAHNFVSVPHIQDFLAVSIMKKNKIVPQNSIFVPGHISCFLIDHNFYKRINSIENDKIMLIKEMFNRHYNLWDYNEKSEILIKEKINKTLSKINEENNNVSLYNNWEWQERQAKFIVNSIRVYDYYNYKWWLPLWDKELIDFWKKVTINYRIDKSLYIEYIVDKYSELTGLSKEDSNKTERNKFLVGIKKYIRRSNFEALKKIYFKLKTKNEYEHPFEWYGIMPKKEFKKLFTGKENINSFISKEILDKQK